MSPGKHTDDPAGFSKPPSQDGPIIVINDDPIQLRVFLGILERAGFSPKGFENAEAALDWFRTAGTPKLIVTDLYMPGIDGWRLCRLLRSPDYPKFNNVPILVTSATFSGAEAAKITVGLGANGFLPCPINGARFLHLVKELLLGRAPQATPRALIVEDDVALASILGDAFTAHTYLTDVAANGQQAWERFDQMTYDVVVLDYHLPDVPGDELLVRFRERRPEAVIIMSTGDPEPHLPVQWMTKGACGYVRKPFEVAYVLQMAEAARRERALLSVEDLLEQRTKELREQAEIHRIVADYTNDWEYWLAPDRRMRFVSPSCERITGFPRSSFTEEPGLVFRLIHPDDHTRVMGQMQDVLEHRIHSFETDFRILTAQGETRWIGSVAVGVHTPTGEFLGVRVSNRDISEQRRAQDERLELERRLLHAQKLESLGVMAGGIAHDFNNLLTAILGNLDIAMLDVPTMSPAHLSIEQALHASRRAADLTRQMLAYSGKGRFALRNLNLNGLVQENVDLFRVTIQQSTSLQVDLEPDIPDITADAGQLQQVVMNLLTNAAEAVGEKSGTVTLATRSIECDEALLNQSRTEKKPQPGSFVSLEVTDTGCGMNEETLRCLFDPFFTTKFMGRGLGMSAVLGIVQRHHGAILVDTAQNQGTRVRVMFPAQTTSSGTSHFSRLNPKAAQRAEPAARKAILIVDDELQVRNACLKLVDRLGFHGIGAADGEEALRCFQDYQQEIACVLLDLIMPKMDGVATYQALKRSYPDARVILCSGYSEPEATERFHGNGLSGFLQKPFGIEALRHKVQQAIETPPVVRHVWRAASSPTPR